MGDTPSKTVISGFDQARPPLPLGGSGVGWLTLGGRGSSRCPGAVVRSPQLPGVTTPPGFPELSRVRPSYP
ncbi:hypothetical protein GCM10009743_10340 [Kribbella swartbergensis]